MPRGGSKPGERRGGRKKGTPNKTTVLLESAVAIMQREGVDPVAILCQAAKGKIKSALRVRAATELKKLGWAERKSVEVSGLGGGSIQVEQTGSALERLTGVLDRIASSAAGDPVRVNGSGTNGDPK